LKGTHPGNIPARFGLIWFSSFRGEDLNVIFYQNMPNSFHQSLVAIGPVVSEEKIKM
jgi:hypothetical protein